MRPDRFVRRALLLAALAALATGCTPAPPQALGTLERDRIALPAPAFEPILAIEVQEGATVQAGDVLVHLDTTRADAALAAALADAARLADALAEARNGARSEEREQARAQVASAAAQDSNARKERERIDALLARGLVPRAQADAARATADSAAAALRSARAAAALLDNGTRVERIAQAEAALAAAQAQVERSRVDRDRLVLRAPRDGLVDSLPYEVGDQVAVGAPLVQLLVGDAPYARIYVPQPLRAGVHVGDRVDVLLDGDARHYAGHVRMVRSAPVFTPYYALHGDDAARLSYLAEVQLEADAATLPPGLPLRAAFASVPDATPSP